MKRILLSRPQRCNPLIFAHLNPDTYSITLSRAYHGEHSDSTQKGASEVPQNIQKVAFLPFWSPKTRGKHFLGLTKSRILGKKGQKMIKGRYTSERLDAWTPGRSVRQALRRAATGRHN